MWIQRMQELYSAVARVVLKNYTLRWFSLHNFQAKEFLLMKFYVNGIAFEYKEILGVNIFRDGEQRISVKRSFGSGRPNKMEPLCFLIKSVLIKSVFIILYFETTSDMMWWVFYVKQFWKYYLNPSHVPLNILTSSYNMFTEKFLSIILKWKEYGSNRFRLGWWGGNGCTKN